MSRVLMILAGGTGGHVFPGLAVAQYLRERGWTAVWLGTRRGMEAALVSKHGIAFDGIGFSGVRGKGPVSWAFSPLTLAWALIQSLVLMFKRRPDVVLGMGGYVSLPSGIAAAILRRPLAIHDANAVAGLANRVLARFAHRVCAGFPGSFDRRYANKIVLTGNPLRLEITAIPPPAMRLADRRGPIKLLVLGGSLGAKALNDVVPRSLALLAPEERPAIVHQAGAKHVDDLVAAYACAGVAAECIAFINDIASRYAACDLVICRAGAITVSELAAAGIASILVPLPTAIADEQTANARYLAEQGAGVLEPQAGLTPERLARRLRQLGRGELMRMAQAAYALGRRDATELVARVCEQVAR